MHLHQVAVESLVFIRTPNGSLKLSGVYQFPWDISVGAFGRYQQGYPYVSDWLQSAIRSLYHRLVPQVI